MFSAEQLAALSHYHDCQQAAERSRPDAQRLVDAARESARKLGVSAFECDAYHRERRDVRCAA